MNFRPLDAQPAPARNFGRRAVFVLSFSLLALSPLGCRSAFVDATIHNNGDSPIRLVEVDYPSASFGTQSLSSHGTFNYHFKIQGSGQVTLTFTSADGSTHTTKGPELIEGQEGHLGIDIDAGSRVTWSERLMKSH